MAGDTDMERALAAVTAVFNDPPFEDFDAGRAQALVESALRGERRLRVDDGGGLHDESGRRVGAIRRTPSGEWITDLQNPAAERSDAPIPAHDRKERSPMHDKTDRHRAPTDDDTPLGDTDQHSDA